MMTVKQLRALLEDADDDMLVVVSGQDHQYFRTGNNSGVVTAERWSDGFLTQHFDGTRPPEHTTLVDVFWIDDGRY